MLAALDLWPAATGLGVDTSRQAMSYAAANARRLDLESRVKFKLGDWAEGIDEAFDLVLCNPPYVAKDAELGPGSESSSRTRRYSPARMGSMPIASLLPNCPAYSVPAEWLRWRSGTIRPSRSPLYWLVMVFPRAWSMTWPVGPRGVANLGQLTNRLEFGPTLTTSSLRTGLAPLREAEQNPLHPRRYRPFASCPLGTVRNERVRPGTWNSCRSACLRRKGKLLVKEVGI
nr:methyltransferase domain-containing protein [Sphingomonas daechungensis]